MDNSKFEHHIHIDGTNKPNLPDENLSELSNSNGSLRHHSLTMEQQLLYERGLRDEVDYNLDETESLYDSVFLEIPIPLKEGRSELKNAIELLSNKTKANARYGKLYRYFDIIVKLILILGSAAVGFILDMDGYTGKFVIYSSYSISVISGLYEIVEFKNRGLIHVQISRLFRKMLRKARDSLMFLQTGDELYHYARHIEEEIDEIELDMYSGNSDDKNKND